MSKINLIKRCYENVRLYPGDVTLKSIYIGDTEDKNVFEHNGDEEKNYVLVDKHWIEKDEEGIITHKGISSFSVQVIPEENISMIKGLDKLIGEDK